MPRHKSRKNNYFNESFMPLKVNDEDIETKLSLEVLKPVEPRAVPKKASTAINLRLH